MDEIGPFDAIYSLRQFTRYKPDAVPREALDKMIDAAAKAPNGGGRRRSTSVQRQVLRRRTAWLSPWSWRLPSPIVYS